MPNRRFGEKSLQHPCRQHLARLSIRCSRPKKCNYCKKCGHVVAQCWKKQREAQPSRDHALKIERSVPGSPRNNLQNIPSSQLGDRQGPLTSKRPRINIVRARVCDFLYPRTATPVDSGLGRHQPHLLGPELLQQSAAPLRDAGHAGRSSGSRWDWYGEAHALGEVQPTSGIKKCVLRATCLDEPDQRAEVVARPLLGGGASAERLVQRRGRTVETAYHAEEDVLILRCHVSRRSRERVQLARAPATYGRADSLEPQAVAMDVDDPRESSGAECAASTSELGGEAVILEEDACIRVYQASEALWHARMGHLNRGNLRAVLRQTGTPYRPLTQAQLLATPQCPACMSGKQHHKRNSRARRPRLNENFRNNPFGHHGDADCQR
jgi:hypothetical protein